jgi:hypothetical protein
MNPRILAGLVIAVVIAVVALSAATVYSSYVAASNHHNSCNARAASADALDSLIAFVLAPKPGTSQSAEQIVQTEKFQQSADAIVDKQRC